MESVLPRVLIKFCSQERGDISTETCKMARSVQCRTTTSCKRKSRNPQRKKLWATSTKSKKKKFRDVCLLSAGAPVPRTLLGLRRVKHQRDSVSSYSHSCHCSKCIVKKHTWRSRGNCLPAQSCTLKKTKSGSWLCQHKNKILTWKGMRDSLFQSQISVAQKHRFMLPQIHLKRWKQFSWNFCSTNKESYKSRHLKLCQ